MATKIDLHIHTNISDGELTPKEIIDEAYNNGVGVIAIADHDTIDAYTDTLYKYAEEKHIQIINAVENGMFHIYPVSTIDEGIEILTGMKYGNYTEGVGFEENTISYHVYNKLKKYAKLAK